MQYSKGKCNNSDRFWAELAYKTRSWLMEVEDPEEIRAVITIAIYKGKGTNVLMVCISIEIISKRRLLFMILLTLSS